MQKFGVVGLAVMGENLALNIERNGFPIAVYNRSYDKTEAFIGGRAKGKNAVGVKTLQELVASLERPRKILLMVKAGSAVDAVLGELKPFLANGDIVIDGGNSHWPDTDRRLAAAAGSGIRFVGMGVSGGEEGALWGPSMMPGGDRSVWEHLEPILTKIAAKADTGPCVTWIGEKSSGHFVKMVHNGIEYGDMQLIAEAYDLLRNGLGLSTKEIADVFAEWNEGELESFLIEITAKIVNFKDDLPPHKKPLIDLIVDAAGQKGTGRWTTEAALDFGTPAPTMATAVDARTMSSMRDLRARAAKVYPPAKPLAKGKAGSRRHSLSRGGARNGSIAKASEIKKIANALYCAKVCSYAQGFDLLAKASAQLGYGLELGELARIWKGGCIIRAAFLDKIRTAFKDEPSLPNLLLDPGFSGDLRAKTADWRATVGLGTKLGITPPAMSASLAYFDSFRRERLPANLIQGQRDFFGAHTYERLDREGVFHTEWSGAEEKKKRSGDKPAGKPAKKAARRA